MCLESEDTCAAIYARSSRGEGNMAHRLDTLADLDVTSGSQPRREHHCVARLVQRPPHRGSRRMHLQQRPPHLCSPDESNMTGRKALGNGNLISIIVMGQSKASGRGPTMVTHKARPLQHSRTRRPMMLHSTVGVQEHMGIQQPQLRTKGSQL